MPVARSKTSICNLALQRAQISKTLSDVDTQSTVEAATCRTAWTEQLEELLEAHAWPFASRRKPLSQLGAEDFDAAETYAAGDTATSDGAVYVSLQDANTGNTPEDSATWWRQVSRDEWAYVYTPPADYVKALKLYDGAHVSYPAEQAEYVFGDDELLGTLVFTDEEDAKLDYVGRHENPALYPPLFAQALAWAISGDLAASLKKDDGLAQRNRLTAVGTRLGAIGRALDGQHLHMPESSYTRARG